MLTRQICGAEDFVEIYVDCPVKVCEDRDPKGMYKKARQGVIPEFTGISAPYEPPERPEIHLHTDLSPVAVCVETIVAYLQSRQLLLPAQSQLAIEAEQLPRQPIRKTAPL